MSVMNESWGQNSLFESIGVTKQDYPMGTLYVVGLPIGNFADITFRALWVLAHADVIAAEDTRETRKLLDHYGIHTRLISVREHNEAEGARRIVSFLATQKRVAMVTDAGTPAISDPGAKVVNIVLQKGYRVLPIPGASAVVTAMSAAGCLSPHFTFVGFLPSTGKARKQRLQAWLLHQEALVFYEAPHRILSLLEEIGSNAPERYVVVAREITKRFETITRLRGDRLSGWAKQHSPKGEYVIVVDELPKKENVWSDTSFAWLQALRLELPTSKLAGIAAKVMGVDRKEVYQWLERQKSK